MKKLLFILNPYAGTRKASKALPDILAVFNRADFDVRVYVTAGPGDAVDAVETLAADMDLVVCSGGDGTFNETVTGLMKAGLTLPIGYIPAGSTNDFAASLGLSSDPVEAARQIVEGVPVVYDAGRFDDRPLSEPLPRPVTTHPKAPRIFWAMRPISWKVCRSCLRSASIM